MGWALLGLTFILLLTLAPVALLYKKDTQSLASSPLLPPSSQLHFRPSPISRPPPPPPPPPVSPVQSPPDSIAWWDDRNHQLLIVGLSALVVGLVSLYLLRFHLVLIGLAIILFKIGEVHGTPWPVSLCLGIFYIGCVGTAAAWSSWPTTLYFIAGAVYTVHKNDIRDVYKDLDLSMLGISFFRACYVAGCIWQDSGKRSNKVASTQEDAEQGHDEVGLDTGTDNYSVFLSDQSRRVLARQRRGITHAWPV